MLHNFANILNHSANPLTTTSAANDNTSPSSLERRSPLPAEAIAYIYKPALSPMTSAKAAPKTWRLRFERRTPPVIEPLMGYTGGDDTLTQVELSFPSLHAAIRYAERNGLTYQVARHGNNKDEVRAKAGANAFSDATLARLGLEDLQETYGKAMAGAAAREDRSGPSGWASPMDVALDRSLSLEAKRSILMNWAYTEYLMDQATGEGMPDNSLPSRLDAVEEALVWLEHDVAGELEPSVRKRA
jgi:hypothetical protein